MTIAPNAAQAQAAAATHEGPPELLLPGELRLTPEQFALVCEANPEAVLELAADGQLIRLTPSGGDTGTRNTLLCTRLQIWALKRGEWMVFDSSTGFRLPDGSVLSPDASVVRLERWQALSAEQRRGFPPLCPDLVVELVSASDEAPRGAEALRRKLAAYLANGALLGWLLFPEERAVELWRPGAEPHRLDKAEVLEGGEVLPGLRLELTEIWES
ncbi:MAG: Uma2 family endonuclease [Synechococcaceae bacterium WB8_1B_136]|nr:Uma2 family endonuclease [Synechococcaceae bacterium WB8_1B_136]